MCSFLCWQEKVLRKRKGGGGNCGCEGQCGSDGFCGCVNPNLVDEGWCSWKNVKNENNSNNAKCEKMYWEAEPFSKETVFKGISKNKNTNFSSWIEPEFISPCTTSCQGLLLGKTYHSFHKGPLPCPCDRPTPRATFTVMRQVIFLSKFVLPSVQRVVSYCCVQFFTQNGTKVHRAIAFSSDVPCTSAPIWESQESCTHTCPRASSVDQKLDGPGATRNPTFERKVGNSWSSGYIRNPIFWCTLSTRENDEHFVLKLRTKTRGVSFSWVCVFFCFYMTWCEKIKVKIGVHLFLAAACTCIWGTR